MVSTEDDDLPDSAGVPHPTTRLLVRLGELLAQPPVMTDEVPKATRWRDWRLGYEAAMLKVKILLSEGRDGR